MVSAPVGRGYTWRPEQGIQFSLYVLFFFMGVGGWAGSFLNLELRIRSCSDPPASAHSVLGGAEGVGERYA